MKLLIRFSTLCLAVGLSAPALADHTVGSGGDAVRFLFEQARTAAVARLSQLKWCSFEPSASPQLVDWILKARSTMEQDIRSSSHLWVVDTQPTCAYTEHKVGAPLYLSYPTCINSVQTDLSKALFVVFHESAHHLGVGDEKEADLIASAIMRATPQVECPSLPNDPFNPQICTGPKMENGDFKKYFAPGENTVYIGNYSTYSRFRSCTNMTGCGQWESGDVTLYNPNHANGQFSFKNFKLKVQTTQNGFKTWLWSLEIAKFASYFYEGNLSSWQLVPIHGGDFWSKSSSGKGAKIGPRLSLLYGGNMTQDCLWIRALDKIVLDSNLGTYTEAETVLTGRH